MYIYLNTHIHKYTHKCVCVCVCDFDKKWVGLCVGVCVCMHYNYEHDISKAQKLRNEKVLRLSADSLYGQNHIAIFLYTVEDMLCMRIQLSSKPKAKHCYVGL